MKRRMLAAFLSVSMLISMSVFVPAYAADTEAQTEAAETTPAATEPAPTAEPTAAPEPTSSPDPTATPEPTSSPEPTATPEPSTSPELTGCTECGYTEGHAENCSQYTAPDPVGCTECGKVDGHEESCSQYVAPEPVGCTECGEIDGHLETCSQYAAPAPDFAGMTAEEIFARWEEYSVEEQQQILDYLAENDAVKCAELLALIDDANTLEEETLSLTVSAMIADGSNPDQDMIFTVSREDGFSVKVVILAKDFVNGSASVTLLLPAGTYTVTADSWSWRYTAEETKNADGSVSFTYTRSNSKWFDGDFSKNICYIPPAVLNEDEE